MNYLEEQTNGEAMINSIQNGDHLLHVVTQVSLAGTALNVIPSLTYPKFWTAEEKKTRKIDRLARYLLIQELLNDIYSLIDSNDTAKDLWDALERQMRGSEYGEQDRKAAILYEYETFKATEGKQQTKNLMDINIDALYNILKQNQGDVNDALGYKTKAVVVTLDLLALVAEKTKVSKSKEKVKVQSESEGSDDEDISDLKKITLLLAKAFNRKNYYAKPTNNNLRISSASSSANKKPEYVKSKSKVKDYNYYKIKMLLAKKYIDEQVLLAKNQAWMESSSDSDQEINANIVFMAKMEKVLSDSDESSSFTEETIAEVAYYASEYESESEYETSEYYDNSINYGLFVNDDDDQEIFHDANASASENFNENHIVSQKDYDKSEVVHNDSEEKDHLVDKLIQKFNHKIAKCQKRIEKANQQSKNLENQNKDLQDKYDVLINQVNTFKEKNYEFNEQIKVLNEKNADLLAQTKVLQDQLKVKHVVIDTHIECQAQYAKLEEERYEYLIRYSALYDNDKQHRKKINEQEIFFDKMCRQLVDMNNNVLRLQEKFLEKETKISELERKKSPGEDGFPGMFYQKYWNLIRYSVCKVVRYFFDTENMLPELNKTLVVLIPKTSSPETLAQFRPISLCNFIYKIISKVLVIYKIISRVLVNRLKPLMSKIISPQQSAFIPGLDLNKAFDRVEWDFLLVVLRKIRFGNVWCNWIHACLTTYELEFMMNGDSVAVIKLQRGLRQGDPISPYLFIIVADVLSRQIYKAMTLGTLSGIKIAHTCPLISHILFADDSFFFLKASHRECGVLENRVVWLLIGQSAPKIKRLEAKSYFPVRSRSFDQVCDLSHSDLCDAMLSASGTFDNRNKVIDFIQDGKWNIRMLRECILATEAELISQIPISQTSSRDKLIWHFDSKGRYTVKSGYKQALALVNRPVATTVVLKRLNIYSLNVLGIAPFGLALLCASDLICRVLTYQVLYKALLIAILLLKAVVESGSQVAISLSSFESLQPWSLAALVDDIRFWSKSMQLSFSWVNRKRNKVADWVARYALSNTFEFSWDATFPEELTSLSRSDMYKC
nr:reverse transcriptase [Tanacetum cinerariifolium]